MRIDTILGSKHALEPFHEIELAQVRLRPIRVVHFGLWQSRNLDKELEDNVHDFTYQGWEASEIHVAEVFVDRLASQVLLVTRGGDATRGQSNGTTADRLCHRLSHQTSIK